ncbi:unnamed protein product [Malus baccata var. baccata]
MGVSVRSPMHAQVRSSYADSMASILQKGVRCGWRDLGRIWLNASSDIASIYNTGLEECNEICYKDPVLKDQQWSACIDRSPGVDRYSEECFHACVSGCGFKFDKNPDIVDKVRPNRPPKPPPVRIIAKNFMDMVAALPAMKLDKLYENAFICEAILRSLPPLAKKYVLQLLCIEVPVTAKSMEEWVLPDGVSKHRVAIDRLIQLRIFTETVDRKRETTYTINPIFQTNLKKLLVHGVVLPREPMPSNITVRLPSLEDLQAFALEQWECFLLQLINSSQSERPSNISSSMMKTFQRGLLSQRDREAPRLTDSGFQFLLMDTNAQLWYIIREYISNSEERGLDSADLISFLLELSFHVTGEAYNINTLNERQKNIIKDLADLGLIKLQQGRKDSWFIPTELATNLSVSLTDSSSRKQIISFLQQNAHPRVAERVPSVPENVTDQIRLWETDLNRVEMTPAYYYDEFPTRELLEGASDFARGYNALLWEDVNSKKMRLVVKAENHVHMREYLGPTTMAATIARICLQSLLKAMNSLLGMVGIAMIMYGLWMLRVWLRDSDGSPLDHHSAVPPWFICTSLGAAAADILLNSDWEKDLPYDRTGKFSDFKDFVESKLDIFQWIGLFIVLAQGLSIVLATALRSAGPNQRSSYDSDEECPPERLPLINPNGQPAKNINQVKRAKILELYDSMELAVNLVPSDTG